MRAERHTNTKKGVNKMSKLSRGIGAVIVCLGMLFSASILFAMQDPPAKTDKEAKKMEKTQEDTTTISGTVKEVTDSAVTIVDAQQAEHTVAVTAETKVLKAGKDAALTDVKANDLVTIEAKKGTGDQWLALKIAVS